MHRRMVIAGGVALLASAGRALPPRLRDRIAALEGEIGGRIGLAIFDTGDRGRFGWRGDERFPMCSTFKFLLAAHILARVDRGLERLDRVLAVTQADLLSYAPFTKTRAGGSATIAELCHAAITISDNTAANLLLAASGGPAGLTAFLRGIGDRTSRLDRTEPTLNEAAPGDPRDTTTPWAMIGCMERLLLGKLLSPASRTRLTDWMLACETGGAKFRAGLPREWRIADKTGSGEHGSDNDIALLWPPARPPLLVASYLTGSDRPTTETSAIHARIGTLLARSI
ncbi:class A beta-lactamase [Sphingomonas bacterium]|uniref:class A beta-lactamase n=1 Tax=Sphingomonas bacterium TaxID=1895847 RepID=UPI001574FD7E|nr:class A beta-lactamase [Sphingomonas bacterium]